LSLPAAQRLPVIFPVDDSERTVNLLGGAVITGESSGAFFCPPGDNCLAGIITSYLPLSWGGREGVGFAIPQPMDFSGYDVLHLRAVPDYTSTLNAPDAPLRFAVVLTDASGIEDEVLVNDLSSQYVPEPAEYYAYEMFALYPASVRIPLGAFDAVDLASINHIALQTVEGSGTLLLADLELLRVK
jgi:hypothetical protein